MSNPTALSVLDLLPRTSGSDNATALRNTIDLAQQVERFGYARYWFAEHHLNPGVIGSSPAVEIALVAGATSTIRLGSAGVQFGHRTPLATVEEFGLIDALYPGRLDLGIGRSITRPAPRPEGDVPSDGGKAYLALRGGAKHEEDTHTDNGLLIPAAYDISKAFSSDQFHDLVSLLQQPGAYAPDYTEQIGQVLALLDGTYTSPSGRASHAAPGEGADIQVWILGASGGQSASVAGENGLRFVASYHHSPSTVIDAVTGYLESFKPSTELAEPYVAVSVDAVIADTDEKARELASGYAPWVRSIRQGKGAIPYPAPDEAAGLDWDDAERELVRDRVLTQFVGSPVTVADQLEQLRDATGAKEISITTITHNHADRVRSYELIAQEWDRRA
jgi:alkanesulfonate monooxygenase SsuD/methylene tetrahydromethanopterin reductase-like flavin-dependent oxidoreductase (luciferase family)